MFYYRLLLRYKKDNERDYKKLKELTNIIKIKSSIVGTLYRIPDHTLPNCQSYENKNKQTKKKP